MQSRDLAGSAGPVAIIHQPDVRRMLMSMRAQTEAARASAYVTAAAFDVPGAPPCRCVQVRKTNQAFYEFMVPIVKGWSTEMSLDVTSTGVQIHGGMGFIEETGAAQHYRDSRILTIYEGTTAIQANDLVGRKTARDGGATAKGILAQVRKTEAELAAATIRPDLAWRSRKQLSLGADALEEVVTYVAANMKSDIKAVFAGSVLYLKLAGIVLGGWQMARAAQVADQASSRPAMAMPRFYKAKIATARFFAEHMLVQAGAYRTSLSSKAAAWCSSADEDRFLNIASWFHQCESTMRVQAQAITGEFAQRGEYQNCPALAPAPPSSMAARAVLALDERINS